MKIRKAKESDFPELFEMAHAFFKLHPYGQYTQLDEESLTATFTNTMKDHVFLVAVDDNDKAVGMAAAFIAPAYWNAEHLCGVEAFWWIQPEHRKNGNGKKLRIALEKVAKSRGVRFWNMASLQTSEPEKMDKMYAKAGFKRTENIYMKVL